MGLVTDGRDTQATTLGLALSFPLADPHTLAEAKVPSPTQSFLPCPSLLTLPFTLSSIRTSTWHQCAHATCLPGCSNLALGSSPACWHRGWEGVLEELQPEPSGGPGEHGHHASWL